MSQIKFTFPVAVMFCALTGFSFTAVAERQISKMSTWELCKNLQDTSSVSSSLRDESVQELETRGADCSFLQSGTSARSQKRTKRSSGKRQQSGDEFDDLVTKGSARGGGPVGGAP